MLARFLLVAVWLLGMGQNSLAVADEPMLENTVNLPFSRVQRPALPWSRQIKAHTALVVKGFNGDTESRIVILRFDDKASGGYHSRLNIERPVNPGAFELHLPLSALKTPDKRLFDWSSWQKFYLFADRNDKQIQITDIALTDDAPFGEQSFGFDLGGKQSPVMTGMSKINIGYAGLKGKHLRARHHSSGNALTSDGIQGIEQLYLRVPNGTWDVVLWHKMPGEWENLPRQLDSKILLQGKPVLTRKLTAKQWLATEYLQGQSQEAHIDGDFWTLHGQRPQDRTQAQVKVTDGILRIALNGATTHDNYLAGVFVTPSHLQGRDIARLQKAVKRRFEQQWPVVNVNAKTAEHNAKISLSQVEFQPNWRPDLARHKQSETLLLTEDSQVVTDFEIYSGGTEREVHLSLTWRNAQGQVVALPTQLRQGFWRYQRPLGASKAITLDADELRAVGIGEQIRLPAELSRRINLLIKHPGDMPEQTLTGELTVFDGKMPLASLQFALKLSDLKLPALSQSVGIYHEKAVHWGWFNGLKHLKDDVLQCDYQLLSNLGFSVLSPPLSTPPAVLEEKSDAYRKSAQGYLDDLTMYHRFFSKPALDYTTVKRFERFYGKDRQKLLSHLVNLRMQLQKRTLPVPHFAVVDEMLPLKPAELAAFSSRIADIRTVFPEANIAGQLNKPQNRQLLGLLDTLIINHGFGVERKDIRQMQGQGKSVWLYNMPKQRLAAGFFLWRSGAQGYLQWHGRMPTGAPYLPVDGREADFQMIYPNLEICPAVPDINARLLALAQGVTDRRWLSWLQRQAVKDKQARHLLLEIKAAVADDWAKAHQLTNRQLQQWRNAMARLASQTNTQQRGHYAKP